MWIAIRGARSEGTRRAYRREAERVLLWAIAVKGKQLSCLKLLNCAEYFVQFQRDQQSFSLSRSEVHSKR
ncbi:integrase [Burkholderia humptydooensis]|uniref:Integrase n=2 Tax=Burkholderia humptydooensis TaxID=430531 RepID=A0A7U4SSB3_9BURK|nr:MULTISPECIES: hypothetical protein [Burkholderia]AJY42975.1 tyrosine recombinase domain protein [Burkholderia sp. 2002721687]ALX42653.1 integrase [Burkholderia humptydooensis]EIP87787.1 phage integrase family protein [Burkholderia humptydooensis MSMB43]QPS42126.1 integrase [Burkholderia humptydooensis]